MGEGVWEIDFHSNSNSRKEESGESNLVGSVLSSSRVLLAMLTSYDLVACGKLVLLHHFDK